LAAHCAVAAGGCNTVSNTSSAETIIARIIVTFLPRSAVVRAGRRYHARGTVRFREKSGTVQIDAPANCTCLSFPDVCWLAGPGRKLDREPLYPSPHQESREGGQVQIDDKSTRGNLYLSPF
jgi:hypothetical protein